MALFRLSNDDLADVLEQVAELLHTQDANPYRIRAYREGARTLRGLDRWAGAILRDDGRDGLEKLPGIGKSLAASLDELLHRGRLRTLERLLGQVSPEDLFATVPGIGEDLAQRIHAVLGVETLEELELCAHDGRLETVPGFGGRRVRLVREALGGMLSRSARRRARLVRRRAIPGVEPPPTRPPVELVLDVDARYRRLARAGKLRTIAPRRFNPDGGAWLPVLHVDLGGWSWTAMYSNTARAHELGRTRDWVVLYHERDGHEEQCTVVTEYRGPLSGRRVVRGRENECLAHHRQRSREARPA
jgi:hypothetical protein